MTKQTDKRRSSILEALKEKKRKASESTSRPASRGDPPSKRVQVQRGGGSSNTVQITPPTANTPRAPPTSRPPASDRAAESVDVSSSPEQTLTRKRKGKRTSESSGQGDFFQKELPEEVPVEQEGRRKTIPIKGIDLQLALSGLDIALQRVGHHCLGIFRQGGAIQAIRNELGQQSAGSSFESVAELRQRVEALTQEKDAVEEKLRLAEEEVGKARANTERAKAEAECSREAWLEEQTRRRMDIQELTGRADRLQRELQSGRENWIKNYKESDQFTLDCVEASGPIFESGIYEGQKELLEQLSTRHPDLDLSEYFANLKDPEAEVAEEEVQEVEPEGNPEPEAEPVPDLARGDENLPDPADNPIDPTA